MSNLMDWAKNEVLLALKREHAESPDADSLTSYVDSVYESALHALEALDKDGHSGMSIGFTKNILMRLIDWKPLTPIEDTPETWSDTLDTSGHRGEKVNQQCLRYSSLFKYTYEDGRVEYHDVNRTVCFENGESVGFSNGLISKIIDELYPITMPYAPPDKRFQVYVETFLVDPSMGDFDTRGVFYICTPDGERVEVNRYYREGADGWTEIAYEEYMARKVFSQYVLKREVKHPSSELASAEYEAHVSDQKQPDAMNIPDLEREAVRGIVKFWEED